MKDSKIRLAIVGWDDNGEAIKAWVDDLDNIVEYEHEWIESFQATPNAAGVPKPGGSSDRKDSE